jgi:hypothetical protein
MMRSAMIGVACEPSERAAAAELFELLKAPWEFCAAGGRYTVLLSSVWEAPACDASLAILTSACPMRFDADQGVALERVPGASSPPLVGGGVPIYGPLARLAGPGRPVLRDQAASAPVALELSGPHGRVLRLGYDLFTEVGLLLADGQPAALSLIPTLDRHIGWLRQWIVLAGLPLLEVLSAPAGHTGCACLTHDIDFAGLRRHGLDHTLLGFLYRALIASPVQCLRGRLPPDRVLRNWLAALSLPLVYLRLRPDFWEGFEDYAGLEGGARSTFFLIPFKHRAGERVARPRAAWRACRYDIADVAAPVDRLARHGCEIALHGLDAWHSPERGRQEKERIAAQTGRQPRGVRIHWLCFGPSSPAALEAAGFDYDSTIGYNDAVGCRAGTFQVFRPLSVRRLLELPLHIQDTALFYPGRLALSEEEAWTPCQALLESWQESGGVVTVLWHDRSLAPERLWGAFYQRLLADLRARGAWFGTASQVVEWYRHRRSAVFEACSLEGGRLRARIRLPANPDLPALVLRIHRPAPGPNAGGEPPEPVDVLLTGDVSLDLPWGEKEVAACVSA